MKHTDAFGDCHPAVSFLFFMTVILITMFLNHPAVIFLSFGGGICYAAHVRGWRTVLKRHLLLSLPLMLVFALINPLFNHYGVTVLFYLNGMAITLEAVIYGLVLTAKLFTSIIWFDGMNAVMTTDKFVYLFGRVVPSLALVLSMAFRFVPRFTRQMGIIRNTQKCLGRDISTGKWYERLRAGVRVLSILITWALENAVDTSDSMKARGHGLPGRSAFSIFKFSKRDALMLIIFPVLLVLVLIGGLRGALYASFNPKIMIGGACPLPVAVGAFICWGLFCFVPILLGLKEDMTFRYLQTHRGRDGAAIWYMNK
ncbi:MAG: energy-coupling factor transporter transmembrane component T [Lachnospiraceae bacterium]|nr:energy-coupling factor transporter transmembrane component T [Lachnospiraceae bacterium]